MTVYLVWYDEYGVCECGERTTHMRAKCIFATKQSAYAYMDGGRHDWSSYHVEEMEVQP